MEYMTKKFLDTYKHLVSEDNFYILVSAINEPKIQKAFLKNKLPTRKVVSDILKSKGARLEDDDQPEQDVKDTIHRQSSSSCSNDKFIIRALRRIEEKLNDLQTQMSGNIDFALPSSDIITDITLSPDDRRRFALKLERDQKLTSNFTKNYSAWLQDGEKGTFDKIRDLFCSAFGLIDKFVFEGWVSKRMSDRCLNVQPTIDPTVHVFVYDSTEEFEDGTPYLDSSVMTQVMNLQRKTKLLSNEVDPIVFIYFTDKAVVSNSVRNHVTVSFYIDMHYVIKNFQKRHAPAFENMTDGIVLATENGTDSVKFYLEHSAFPFYFLDLCRDAAVHMMCCFKFKDPCYSHNACFEEVFREYFQ